MGKIILSTSFFIMAPMLLFITIIYYLYLSYNQTKQFRTFDNSVRSVAFAALPSFENVVMDKIEGKDAKLELVRLFFTKYNSPLEPFSQDIIDAANLYDIDFRLLPAIAMQESNLCKKAPVDSYNCWGFGIYGKKVTRFESYKEAIYAVTKTLSKQYKNRGLETPEEIMTKYTPSNKGDWAYSVSLFMNRLK